MLGKSQNAPIDAFVSSPDPKLTSARRLGNLLRNCGINPTRWVPPTDAMCFACYRDYLPMDDYYLLAAYLGSTRVNVALYDCSRNTIECLAMRQGTLESGSEARYSTFVALVTQLDRDSEQRLRHSGGKRFRLRVSVIDEEGQGAIVETGIEAALRELPLVTECLHLEPSDVARGLAMYIDTVAGPTNDGQSTQRTVLLQRMGFSVSLAGTRKGRMELVSANDIIPFDSKTVQLIDNQGIGTPTHILLLRTDGTGIRVPLPKEAKQLCAKWAQIGVKDTVFLPAVDTTVSVDASRHITLELRGPEKNLPQGQTVRIRVDELLGDAEAIAPKERTQHVSSRSSAPITAQSASRITAVGLTIIAILIVVLVATNTGNQSRTSTTSTQSQPAATDNTEADNASTRDKETKEDGEETNPWGPLNDNLPDNFPNPYEGEFGSWKDGIYTSEELGLRIVKSQNVYPAKIHNEASYSKSNGLRFDMGKDEIGSPVYNAGYDCVYVTRLDSTAMGISRVDIPDLPDGMTIEESLDSDEDLERVKFHGKTWWHHTIQEDGQLFETYFIPAGTRVARLAVVTEYSISGPGYLQTMLDAIKDL